MFLELSNFLRCLHYLLLHECLFLLEFSELALHVLVFISLLRDLVLKVFEIGDDQRINHLDVLVIECLQVVVHHSDVLAETLNLFFVFTQN